MLAIDAVTNTHHVKNIKPIPNRKSDREVPLLDSFPCTVYGRMSDSSGYSNVY